ncbi:hypothetical protein SAMN05421858_5002 [Haladaptatus litoreus]|uniref:SWIM-type domain-containing protein n=1 Tax=Haladaptatus litoreus TaxID=553468 RepID=A0A1N7FE52_9EURY|nr:hypothetical protein SAMN05421858_5002 [Haladaptatus litoreus]
MWKIRRRSWKALKYGVSLSFETPRCCESHDKPAAHQYTVTIDDVTEELMACTCPHHVHRNAYCKHMAAVEGATDDGTLTAFPSEDDDDTEPDDCDCDGLSDFPCWSCVRTGRKELPN